MKKERIEKAVEIINYAIQNQISVKEASVKCGMSDTYVKNVKALVHDLYEEGELDIDLFQQFDEAYKRYIDNKGSDSTRGVSTIAAAVCATRSITVGIKRVRSFPLGFCITSFNSGCGS